MQRWVLKASLYPQLHHPATPRSKQGGTAVSEGKARRGLFFFSPLILNQAMCMFHRVQNMSLGTGAPSKAPLVRLCETSGRGGEFLEEREEGTAMAEKPNVKEGFIPLVHQPEAPTPSPFCLSLQSEHTSSPFCLLLFAGSPAFCLSSDVHRGFSLAFGVSGHVNPPPWAEETKVKWPLS